MQYFSSVQSLSYRGRSISYPILKGIKAIASDREVYEAQLEEIAKHRSLNSKNISKVQSDYGKLYSNIKKLQPSYFSLSKILEISNSFKMLESKNGER